MTKLGKNWILLTGLSRESGHWGAFTGLLQTAFPDARISALDLPGTGRRHRQNSPNTISAITGCVRRYALDQDCLQQPATLLALSLGGMVAWEWLLNYPDDCCGAVLIGSSFGGLSPFYQRLRWQRYGQLAALALKTSLQDRELALLQLISNRRDHDSQVAKQWWQIQIKHPVSPKNCFRQIQAATQYQALDKKPKQPVLLINSTGDRLVAPECSEAMQKKWGLELKTHAWAGHELALDDGPWLIAQLQTWVNRERAKTFEG
jgi:pimeloyl-ACP methyl ester carboxylesterase